MTQVRWTCEQLSLINNKSTATGGETPKGSAVPGVPLSHRDLGQMNGTLFGPSFRDRGPRVSAVSPDENPFRRCIHEQEKLRRNEDQGELNLDSTQRPLQGAFLIPPVLPVVLIRIDCLVKLDNESKFFTGLEHNSKFDVIVIGEADIRSEFDAAFFKKAEISAVEMLKDLLFSMPHALVRKVSPKTLSVPEVYSCTDRDILANIYDNSTLIPAEFSDFKREFDITNDSRYFAKQGDLPLYQGAMIWHFDHRYNFWVEEQRKWHRGKLETVELRPFYPIRPKSWVSLEGYEKKFPDRKTNGQPDYTFHRLAYRIQSSLSNQRTFVSTILPKFVAAGNSLGLLVVPDPIDILYLCSILNSSVYDFVVRTKITSNVSKFYIEQLPFPLNCDERIKSELASSALRLYATMPHFDGVRECVKEKLSGDLRAIVRESHRRHEKARVDALTALLFKLSVDAFVEIAAKFPLVDRQLPAEQRQSTLAVTLYKAFAESGDYSRCRDLAAKDSGDIEIGYGNHWVPPDGWNGSRFAKDDLLNEGLWNSRRSEIGKINEARGQSEQGKLFE